MIDLARAEWRKSSRSPGNTNCVEVAGGADAVAVRDSTDPHGPVLRMSGTDWRTFLATLRVPDGAIMDA